MIDNLCKQGFHIIDNFLDPKECNELRVIAQQMYQQGQYRSAKIGFNTKSQLNNAIRTDEIAWFGEDHPEPAIKAYLQTTHELMICFNRTLFLGLNEFETHFAAYQTGAFYKKHTDQFATNKSRKISCVYYLNEDWTAALGGELKLYAKDEQIMQSVLPIGNRFICFTSDLLHEVCVTNQTRFSIAGWMKTRKN